MNSSRYKWNLSPNNLVVRYPPLAGGNFFKSMLSYFERFQFTLPLRQMNYDLSCHDLDSLSHHIKMMSVPPPEFRNHWCIFEPPRRPFWGFTLSQIIKQEHYDEQISLDQTYELMPKQLPYFLDRYICMHLIHESSYQELKAKLPNAKIVTLVEARELQQKSLRFKLQHPNSTKVMEPFQGPDCYAFSMKNIFDKKLFFKDLSNFAFTLSGNSVFDPRMEEYYDKYVAAHSDER